MRAYSLSKSKKILTSYFYQLRKSKESYSRDQQKTIIQKLENLQEEILKKDKQEASDLAREIEVLCSKRKKGSLVKNFVLSLVFALVIAGIVRQTWFELYEIPTGSMRPTFKEKDRLIVSKSKLGINIPFLTKHFYFDPNLCKRMSSVVFTSKGMDVADNDTMYFYLFPGKKQFVKRLIGKPGDTIYFYGGLMYGIDKEGKDITKELQSEAFASLEHIPFIRFEGRWKKSQSNGRSSITMNQMGTPVVELTPTPFNTFSGKTISSSLFHRDMKVRDYKDIWGFKNYGMARLLSANELPNSSNLNIDKDCLYLQIQHPPSLNYARAYVRNLNSSQPIINYDFSYIPLNATKQKAVFSKLYTARFVIKDGYAYRYGSVTQERRLSLNEVPDGIYEFYDGVAYQIDWSGTAKRLPETHPLYQFSKERVKFFYNQGIDFHPFLSSPENQSYFPSRYAYFRLGNLYLMGYPIFNMNDSELIKYIQVENQKMEVLSNYTPFVDHGPPVQEEGLDVDFIKNYGLRVPEGHYLMLGDNHAMSADSRDFGFVPEKNIKGTPSFIFWPLGQRWGFSMQPFIPFLTIPNIIIWSLGIIFIALSTIYSKKRSRFPVDFSNFSFE